MRSAHIINPLTFISVAVDDKWQQKYNIATRGLFSKSKKNWFKSYQSSLKKVKKKYCGRNKIILIYTIWSSSASSFLTADNCSFQPCLLLFPVNSFSNSFWKLLENYLKKHCSVSHCWQFIIWEILVNVLWTWPRKWQDWNRFLYLHNHYLKQQG